jgi:hypothetical protein
MRVQFHLEHIESSGAVHETLRGDWSREMTRSDRLSTRRTICTCMSVAGSLTGYLGRRPERQLGLTAGGSYESSSLLTAAEICMLQTGAHCSREPEDLV